MAVNPDQNIALSWAFIGLFLVRKVPN